MNEHINELLSAYIDDELSEREYTKVQNHLAICGQCKNELDELQSVRDGILSLYSSIEIPDFYFEQTVLNKIREMKSKNTIAYNWIAGMTTAFFAILMGLFIFTFSDALYVGITITSEIVKIAVSLSQTVASVLSSIPFLLEVFAITTIIIVGLSVWSVRYLLKTKTVE